MSSARLLIPLVMALLYFALDVLIYKRLKLWYGHKSFWPAIKIIFWTSLGLVIIGLIQAFGRSSNPPIFPSWIANYFQGLTFAIMIGKLIYGLLLLLDLVIGWPYELFKKIKGSQATYSSSRRSFVQATGTVLAGLPFLSLIQGITFGKYNYQIRKVPLVFSDLPKSFHGFKIVQISDIHSGSFDDKDAVARGVQMVLDEEPDLITFTGDLVNARTEEIYPFIDVFKKLAAPYGVLSTKGNHDYGLYFRWNNQQEHIDDQLAMEQSHKKLGFDLLNNEHRILEKNGESISLVGVENWGKSPFPQIGDLDKALKGTETTPFTILLSHDPSHWEEIVLNHPRHVHLTLAGHTHGMQFGVEIPGFKWSPVKYRYPRWAGLYQEKNQFLYVNRGFGFIGLPGRVGIKPEITVFELKNSDMV